MIVHLLGKENNKTKNDKFRKKLYLSKLMQHWVRMVIESFTVDPPTNEVQFCKIACSAGKSIVEK